MESIVLYEPNIRQLAQNIHIGPQAALFEALEEFNNKYIANEDNHYNRFLAKGVKPLRLTKKFYWKPGAYETIKAIISASQCFGMKANSLSKVLERVRNDGVWRMRNIDAEIAIIENLIHGFRRNGIVQQNNTNDAVEAYEIIKNHFIDQLSIAHQDFKIGSYSIFIEPEMNDNQLEDYYIWVIYYYKDPVIKYNHANTTEGIADIELPGEAYIKFRFSVSKLINILLTKDMDISKLDHNCLSSSRYNNRKNAYRYGGYFTSEYSGLYHPYITRPGGYNYSNGNDDNNFRYVCFGNLYEEIKACIGTLDFLTAKIYIDRLITHYDTRTGPLNPLNMTYHGIPHSISKNTEFPSINPLRVDFNCSYLPYIEDMDPSFVSNDSYCAIHCSYKDKCKAFKAHTTELTQGEIELKALESATINAARRI